MSQDAHEPGKANAQGPWPHHTIQMQPVDDGGVQSPSRMNEEFNLQFRHQRAIKQGRLYSFKENDALSKTTCHLTTKMGSSPAGGSGLHCAGGCRGEAASAPIRRDALGYRNEYPFSRGRDGGETRRRSGEDWEVSSDGAGEVVIEQPT